MSAQIPLSKKHGLNPCMAICPRCLKDHNSEIFLLGASVLTECPMCKAKIYRYAGRGSWEECPNCGEKRSVIGNNFPVIERDVDGSAVRIVGSQLCEKCKKEVEEYKVEVLAGGVHWRCANCRSAGVIKAHAEMAKQLRDKHHELEGKEFGVEWPGCPRCDPQFYGKEEEDAERSDSRANALPDNDDPTVAVKTV